MREGSIAYDAGWVVDIADDGEAVYDHACPLSTREAAEEYARRMAARGPCGDWWITERVVWRRREPGSVAGHWQPVDDTRWTEGVPTRPLRPDHR